jgi:hypothetical protein
MVPIGFANTSTGEEIARTDTKVTVVSSIADDDAKGNCCCKG